MSSDLDHLGTAVSVPTQGGEFPASKARIKKTVVCIPDLYPPSVFGQLDPVQSHWPDPGNKICTKSTVFLPDGLA
jgi:hypothetical protein